MVATALAGCSVEAFIPRLPVDRATGTEILVVGLDGGDPESTYVFDLANPQAFDFALPRGERRLEAFVFPLSPRVLDIEPGRDTLDTGSPPNPDDYDAFAATVSGDDAVTWAEEPSPQWAGRLRIPVVDARRCLLQGGCFEDDRCQVPCGVEVVPTPPELPTPPSDACPAGWMREEVGRVADWPDGALPLGVCRPWAERPTCPLGTAPRPGGACERIAPECPADEFPPDAVGVENHYVRVDAQGGDGSRAAPHGTLAEAVAAATAPARIVLGAGTHDVAGTQLEDGVDLFGVCPEEARVVGRIAVRPDADVELGAFTVANGGLDIRGTASLTGVVVERSTANAVDVERGATLAVTDVDVRGPTARAVRVQRDGVLTGSGLYVSDTESALVVQQGRVDLADVFVDFDGVAEAFEVFGSQATLRRAFIDGTGAKFEGSNVVLEDVTLVNTSTGAALNSNRTTMNATRLAVTDSPSFAVVARTSGSFTAADVVLARVATATTTPRALVTADVETQIDRLAVIDSGVDGVFVANATVVTLRDLVFHRIGTRILGTALRADNVESLAVSRSFMSSLGGAAVYVNFDPGAVIEDVTVRDAGGGDCINGTLLVRKGSFARVNRFDARGLYGAGALVDDATLELTDGYIEDVSASVPCDRLALPHDPGTGIHFLGGDATLRDFVLSDARAFGMRILGAELFSSLVRASRGVVAGSAVGIEVGIVEPEYADLLDRVDYSMNEVILFESGPL